MALPVGNADCSRPGCGKDGDTGDHFGGGDDGVPGGVLEVARCKN